MTTQQIAWFADLVAVAEELGYRVAGVTGSEIELHEAKGDAVIVLRSVFLSGDLLRRTLARPKPRVTIENTNTLEDLRR